MKTWLSLGVALMAFPALAQVEHDPPEGVRTQLSAVAGPTQGGAVTLVVIKDTADQITEVDLLVVREDGTVLHQCTGLGMPFFDDAINIPKNGLSGTGSLTAILSDGTLQCSTQTNSLTFECETDGTNERTSESRITLNQSGFVTVQRLDDTGVRCRGTMLINGTEEFGLSGTLTQIDSKVKTK
jgi:hypothetical protein